jgi:hypothetical protein
MIVVTVTDNNGINDRNVGNVDGAWRVSLWSHEADWTTPRLEDRIEKDSQAARELDIVACVSQPCCS